MQDSASAVLLAVLMIGAIFVVPSAANSNPVAAGEAANSQPVGNDQAVGNNEPIEDSSTTSTPTSTPTPTPAATPTPNKTSNSTNTSQGNLSEITAIIEVAENGTRMMVTLQGTDKVDKIQSARVEGATIQKPLDIDDEYPMATGRVDRPTTVEVIITFDDTSEQTIASRHVNETDS